ncbi:hypothetical protein BD324DRAFT_651551 [Kockovaella imperatae]|uniref:Restriction of telomere capping protein 4 n=1 Tax=Kockovaella imperatae TaxID=4999 RepID=A0A1Y1UE38_9TREE|nr:hypothetical protein BD324DRAFT_651551 [Kockovaella imperatae]ORX36311.1 hypothetical protein BD324DRAFT_651551 [Kockovaella imperatae]
MSHQSPTTATSKAGGKSAAGTVTVKSAGSTAKATLSVEKGKANGKQKYSKRSSNPSSSTSQAPKLVISSTRSRETSPVKVRAGSSSNRGDNRKAMSATDDRPQGGSKGSKIPKPFPMADEATNAGESSKAAERRTAARPGYATNGSRSRGGTKIHDQIAVDTSRENSPDPLEQNLSREHTKGAQVKVSGKSFHDWTNTSSLWFKIDKQRPRRVFSGTRSLPASSNKGNPVLVPDSSASSVEYGGDRRSKKPRLRSRNHSPELDPDEDVLTPRARRTRAPINDHGATDFFASMKSKTDADWEKEARVVSQDAEVKNHIGLGLQDQEDEESGALDAEDDHFNGQFTAEEIAYCEQFVERSRPCRYCGEPMPKVLSHVLQDLDVEMSLAEASLPRGRKLSWERSVEYCGRHEAETTVIPLGKRAGYPNRIDFDQTRRILERPELRSRLEAVSQDPLTSTFFTDILRTVKATGRNKWQQNEAVLAASLPGYYGDHGRNVLLEHFLLLLKWKLLRVDRSKIQPLSVSNFIQLVLVPEAAVLLIMVDKGWKCDINGESIAREEAMQIRAQSWRYGHVAFPESAREITKAGEKEWIRLYHENRHLDTPSRRRKKTRVEASMDKPMEVVEVSSDTTDPSECETDWSLSSELSDASGGGPGLQSADESDDARPVIPRSRARSERISTPNEGEDEHEDDPDTTIKLSASQASSLFDSDIDPEKFMAAAAEIEGKARMICHSAFGHLTLPRPYRTTQEDINRGVTDRFYCDAMSANLRYGSLMDEEKGKPSVPEIATSEIKINRRWAGVRGVCKILVVVLFVAFLGHRHRHHIVKHEKSGPIDWKPCFDGPHALCGTFEVPTDHDDPSYGSTWLSMAKIPHDPQSGSRLGSVYTNPGGPGGSGRAMCLRYGETIRDLVGGRFDIICFDPRGISRTVPHVNCWGQAEDQAKALRGTVLDSTFEVPLDLGDPASRALLEFQQKQALELMELQATVCNQTMGAEVLKWMGTTTLIKDMMYMKNAIDGKDEPINFHGGSYGTIVADYLVNMYPNQVGAVISHGVVDASIWSGEYYETFNLLADLLEHADAAFESFIEQTFCAEQDPSLQSCVKDTLGRIEKLWQSLYQGKQVIVDGDKRGLLPSGEARKVIFNSIQSAAALPGLMAALQAAMDEEHPNLVPLYEMAQAFRTLDHDIVNGDGYVSIGQGDLARLAVSCADQPAYPTSGRKPTARELVNNLYDGPIKASKYFGATVHLMEQHGGCQFWPRSPEPVDRFTGPWNATLRQRMLLVSNENDPITPAKSGSQVAKRQGASAHHLIQPGIGHSYLVTPSECYKQVAKRYFETGHLPDGDETICHE